MSYFGSISRETFVPQQPVSSEEAKRQNQLRETRARQSQQTSTLLPPGMQTPPPAAPPLSIPGFVGMGRRARALTPEEQALLNRAILAAKKKKALEMLLDKLRRRRRAVRGFGPRPMAVLVPGSGIDTRTGDPSDDPAAKTQEEVAAEQQLVAASQQAETAAAEAVQGGVPVEVIDSETKKVDGGGLSIGTILVGGVAVVVTGMILKAIFK